MSRLGLMWTRINRSLWFLPALLTVGAVIAAVGTVWLDRFYFTTMTDAGFIFAVSAEGARGVLSTVAGSIITVTGVVFSITIVVLQLAASQYSSRVLRSFTEDRANQLVLGVFIGTFTYSLIVLRTVRSTYDDYNSFVPVISVNVGVLLALVSMGFLIFFINHIAKAIQAETIIARVTRDALDVVDTLFPEQIGEGAPEDDVSCERLGNGECCLTASTSGYVQTVDEDGILRLAAEHETVLRLDQRIGTFVVKGDPLISSMREPQKPLGADKLRPVVRIGIERTPDQDVERGLIELTDIAVKALSPGINDPTTAIACIYRLTEIFTVLGTRQFPVAARKGPDGKLRVIAKPTSFDRLVSLAYGQVREHGARLPTILQHLRTSLEQLLDRLPARHHGVLMAEIERLMQPAKPIQQ